MPTPAWIAATDGQPPLAAQVNQLLGTHAATYLYTGVSLGGSTPGTGAVATNGLYIAESFSPGSSQTPGRFVLTMSVTGTPGPLTLTIQTDSAGAPSGTVLAATVVPYTYLTGAATATSIPLPCSFAGGSTYWLVAAAVGDAGDFYSFTKSTAVSGVSTSTNGTSWTAQAYGLTYVRYDQSSILPLVHTWEDSGTRWTALGSYNASSQPGSLREYTVAQGAAQYMYSTRSMTYSGSVLTSVA